MGSIDVPDKLRGKAATLEFRTNAGTVYLDDIFFKSEVLKFGNPILNGQEARNTYTNFTNNYLIERPQYTFSYNNSLKGPNWVAYQYDRSWLGTLGRPEEDRPWTTIPGGSEFGDAVDYPWKSDQILPFADLTWGSDYRRNDGRYDRGHMVTQSHRNRTRKDQLATYFTSTMLPQQQDNNSDNRQSAWYNFERFIKDDLVTTQNKELYVISGGHAFNSTLQRDGFNVPKNIKVPDYTWKVVAILDPGQQAEDFNPVESVIAVMTPNISRPRIEDFPVSGEFLPGRQMTINSIEEWRNWETWQVDYTYIEDLVNLKLFPGKERLSSPLMAETVSNSVIKEGTLNVFTFTSDGILQESSFKNSTYGPSQIGILKVGSCQVSSFHNGSSQIGSYQAGATEITPSQVGISEVASPEISFSQVNSTQISITEIGFTQVASSQIDVAQINPTKISLSSSITLQQFLSSHHFTLQNTTVPAWTSFLQRQTPFNLNLVIKDLPTGQLAEASLTSFDASGRPNSGTLLLDHNANGLGWFIDSTPFDNSEFNLSLTDSAYKATQGSPAFGRYDLLTTILHELGHLNGIISGNPSFDAHVQSVNGSPVFVGNGFTAHLTPDGSHLDSRYYPYDLMNTRLALGVRKLPSALDLQILQTIWQGQGGQIGQAAGI